MQQHFERNSQLMEFKKRNDEKSKIIKKLKGKIDFLNTSNLQNETSLCLEVNKIFNYELKNLGFKQ